MADKIVHLGTVHEQASTALTRSHEAIGRVHDDLHSTANSLMAVWTGVGADEFYRKHQDLLKCVAGMQSSAGRIESLRQSAHEDILAGDNKIQRVFEGG